MTISDADETTDALVRDWSRWCDALGGHALSRQEKDAALTALGIPVPPLNCVFTTRSGVTPSSVEILLDVAKKAGLPHQLEVRPGCTSALAELAQSRGMQPGESIPLMRREVLDSGLGTIARNPGFVIREIGAEEANLHVTVAHIGFDAPETMFATLMAPSVFALEGLHCYVGLVDGEPVTTAVGVIEGAHVSIYNVATLPSHRGRGYGAAITDAAVRHGFEAGASFALLQSSEAGYGVYQALGFRTLENWATWVDPMGGPTWGNL